ncbi:hypothetical protein BGZ83_005796 [Gryganskiella cystojenkinii]|nr:hypothetical protein BGZ83_005796 [Gryganskiella cystojenkinii]
MTNHLKPVMTGDIEAETSDRSFYQGRESLSKHSLACFSWKQDTASDEQFLDEFNKELNRVTRHPATSRLLDEMFEPAELRLPNGEKEFALMIPRGSKRLLSGTMAHVHVVKRRAPEVVKDVQINVTLNSHGFGCLVRLEDYKRLENDDPLWNLPLTDNGELLAQMFEGMLICSAADILLAYKVEVNGTAAYEDSHAQEVVKPEGRNMFKVENVYHDSTHKVMVGAIKWSVLVTMAVMLTDGTVVVGPNNKIFSPKATSSVLIKNASYKWIKNKPLEHLYNTMERQLRSGYDNESTFALFSAVNPLFNHHTTMPVTLKTLYAFKCNKVWSGVKVASFVFHQLYSKRKIVKAEVETHVKEALSGRRSCETLRIVTQMVEVMAEEEKLPVSKVNKCLTELASTLSGELTTLNNTDVKNAVLKKIRSMIL